MIFPYTSFAAPQPVWSLHGRPGRPRPLLFVAVIGPTGTAVERGLLDTGADDTVFPEVVAADVGIDLTNAPIGTAAGVGQVPAIVRYAEVRLRISDEREHREWTGRVGFTSAPLHRPLLGFAGFLQFFTATFHGDRELAELTVNSAYRGT